MNDLQHLAGEHVKTYQQPYRTAIVAIFIAVTLLPIAVIAQTHKQNDSVENSQAASNTISFTGSQYYPPLQWLDEQQQPQGFITELERALGAQGGFNIEQELQPWNNALQAVLNGEADAVALIPSAARSAYFDFSEPFYYVAHGIFSSQHGTQFGSLEQLAGKIIAVANGAFAQQQLRDRNGEFILITANNELHCLQLVQNGQADACVEVTTTSRHLITANNLQVTQSSPPFWPQSYAFGVKKGNQELLTRINQSLAMLQVSGTYQTVYERWVDQLEWQQRTFADNLKALAWLLIAIVTLTFAGFGWSYSLKRQVNRKTFRLQQELKRRQKLHEQLQYHARHDSITGLYNRIAFTDKLCEQLVQIELQKTTLVVIRISNIESITSAFGYTIATDLLREFAERLHKRGFNYAAHFGVGLFAAVADSQLTDEEVVELAMHPLKFDSLDFEPMLAFGFARALHQPLTSEQGHELAQELLRQALTAVSVAQKHHKTWINYTSGLEPNADDLRLLKDFHAHGTRDFFLMYQPKLDLATNTIKGAEALIRWQHPDLGLIPPIKFIPLLEETGMVTQVTRWVITQTIDMMKRHQLCEKGIIVSVNVSTRDLTELGFVGFVQNAVKDFKPQCLQFELTETGLIDDSERALYVLSQLNKLGISCAVDDFGTGNSSLSYLSKFPVSEIKLDRSYVFDITSNERNLKIVHSTIELAHTLGLKVTAEGVEEVQTIELLKRLKCETAQGYAISRPVPEKEIVGMF